MEPQLHLITPDEGAEDGRRPSTRKLSRRTVETGRVGVAAARAALEAARQRHPANPRDAQHRAA